MSLLKIDRVSAGYGRNPVLHEISLSVEPGEAVTLIGGNGVGKTTTLRVVSGMLKSTSGSLTFEGQDLGALRPDRIVALGIAHCPEERQLFPNMTVLENLEMGAYLNRGGFADQLERVYALFPRISERRRQRAGSLSGGEQQMVAIGRTLMSNPRLILFDEPSLGLSPLLVREMAIAIRGLNRAGIAVLLVEQNVHMAFQVTSKGYVMEGGRITLHGPTEELAAADHVRQAYLGG